MTSQTKVKKAVEWYSRSRPLYKALGKRVESITREILNAEGINHHSITSRAKSIDSYEKKASKKEYEDPLSEIKDMAGIRVITYLDIDAKEATSIIQKGFEILPNGIVDKTEELGVNKVGYRSIHCIATLGKQRLRLPENKKFNGMCFEIQIRTILQHAWAEFEHDRNYKFAGVLPDNLRRRLLTVAGTIELIDREFDNISRAMDDYSDEVEQRTESGDLNIPLDSISLLRYMVIKFQPLIQAGLEASLGGLDEGLIQSLSDFGIDNIQKLEDSLPEDLVEKNLKHMYPDKTFSSILNEVMAISDADKFVKIVKKRHPWMSIPDVESRLLKKEYDIDLRKVCEKHGLELKRED